MNNRVLLILTEFLILNVGERLCEVKKEKGKKRDRDTKRYIYTPVGS